MSSKGKYSGSDVELKDCASADCWKRDGPLFKVVGTNLCLYIQGGDYKYKGGATKLANCNSNDARQKFNFDTTGPKKWMIKMQAQHQCVTVGGCWNEGQNTRMDVWEMCNLNNCYWFEPLAAPTNQGKGTCPPKNCNICKQCLEGAVKNYKSFQAATDKCSPNDCIDPDSTSSCANLIKVCDDPGTTCLTQNLCNSNRIKDSWKQANCNGFPTTPCIYNQLLQETEQEKENATLKQLEKAVDQTPLTTSALLQRKRASSEAEWALRQKVQDLDSSTISKCNG